MQTVSALPLLGGFQKRLDINIDVVKYPGALFPGSGSQYSTQVLNYASAKSYRCRQEKSTQVGAVEPFADKLAGGDENLGITGMEALQDNLPLAGVQITGENIGAEAIAEFQ